VREHVVADRAEQVGVDLGAAHESGARVAHGLPESGARTRGVACGSARAEISSFFFLIFFEPGHRIFFVG
jgi:hypothetical protein